MVTAIIFTQVKRTMRKIKNSPPSSFEVKNEWRYNATPAYASNRA